MIINTNIEALKTTNILNESHSLLARSLARLSSGEKKYYKMKYTVMKMSNVKNRLKKS